MQSTSPAHPEAVAAVRSAPLLASLGPDTLAALSSAAEIVEIGDGEDVLAAGDRDALYVVIDGSLDAV